MERERRKEKGYKQLLRIQINENRFIVVSRNFNDKILMAQQIKVEDRDGSIYYHFIKNAFMFQSDEDFDNFREELQKIDLKM